jgi:hypothetical protein
METYSVTLDSIKNKVCIVCGAGFSISRAGKLYCSTKCKQFAYYHKDEIEKLKNGKRGINNEPIQLSIREFKTYDILVDKAREYQKLKDRQKSSFLNFEEQHAKRLEELEKQLPVYLKQSKPVGLTIEKWSFIKVLYPQIKNEEFFKLIASFSSKFLEDLFFTSTDDKKEKNNLLRVSFQNHLLKIAKGRIIFN